MRKPFVVPPSPEQRRVLTFLLDTLDRPQGLAVPGMSTAMRTDLQRGGWIRYSGRAASGDRTYRITEAGREALGRDTGRSR